jgi:hypothetical protein
MNMSIDSLHTGRVRVVGYFNVLRGRIVAAHINRELVLIEGTDLFGTTRAWAPLNWVEVDD